MNKHGIRYCKSCGNKLHSNGNQRNGKRRWRCRLCGTARVRTRLDVTGRNRLRCFVRYLLGFQARKNTALVRSDAYADCWCVIPEPYVTGEIYDYIVIDGTTVGSKIVAIARSSSHCLAWQYGDREQSELWLKTLRVLPPPYAVICDGQKGILKALATLWPDAIIQRCHVHVRRNIRTKLTRHPQSTAGKDLQWLVRSLKDVASETDMAVFIALFVHLHETHEAFLREKTMNPDSQGRRKWWYTHRNVRSAYRQIESLIQSEQLFAYVLYPELELPNQTNQMEGGINSPIQELLYRHRGMKQIHQERLVDWYLDSRTERPYFTRKKHQDLRQD